MPRPHPNTHERAARHDAFEKLIPHLKAGTLRPGQAAALAAYIGEEVRLGEKTRKSLNRTNKKLREHREAADAAIREAEGRAHAAGATVARVRALLDTHLGPLATAAVRAALDAEQQTKPTPPVDACETPEGVPPVCTGPFWQERAEQAEKLLRAAEQGSHDAERARAEAEQHAQHLEGADTMRRRALAEALDIHPDTPWPTLISHAREAHQWATRAATERQEREAAAGPVCEQHPDAPVIGGMCGACTQYPADMRPADSGPRCQHRGPHPGFTCAEVDASQPYFRVRWEQEQQEHAEGPPCDSVPGCDGECCKRAPAAAEDEQRAARRASIRLGFDRLALGMTSPEEERELYWHVITEIREHDTARAVAAGNLRHVRTLVPEINRLTAELEDAETRATGFLAERDQAQAALERVRAVRDDWVLKTLEPGQVRRLLDDVTHALDSTGRHECEHGRVLVEYQTVITRVAGVLQDAETHRKTVGPDEWENCAACGEDHAAEALRVLRSTGAPSVDVLVDGARLTRERDGWKLRATLAEAELRTLRCGVRALGGDPTQVQNLWAQLRVRNRQWAEAKRERDEYAGRCGEAEAGEDVARHRAEEAAAALGDVLGMFSPVRVGGAVAFYQATKHPVRPDRYAWWADVRAAAVPPEEGPRRAVRGDQGAEHTGRICERRTSPRVEQGAAAGSN